MPTISYQADSSLFLSEPEVKVFDMVLHAVIMTSPRSSTAINFSTLITTCDGLFMVSCYLQAVTYVPREV